MFEAYLLGLWEAAFNAIVLEYFGILRDNVLLNALLGKNK